MALLEEKVVVRRLSMWLLPVLLILGVNLLIELATVLLVGVVSVGSLLLASGLFCSRDTPCTVAICAVR